MTSQLLRRGVWLEAATVGWNVIEGIIAVGAGAVASSVALIAVGVDSFVETASGAIHVTLGELRDRRRLQRRASERHADAVRRG